LTANFKQEASRGLSVTADLVQANPESIWKEFKPAPLTFISQCSSVVYHLQNQIDYSCTPPNFIKF